MVEYNIVKHCRLCKTRFVVNKSEAREYYCDKCKLKINKEQDDSEGGKK